MTSLLKPVLVSASVPDPTRDPRYFDTADNVAVRDAITALVQVVTPVGKLVFGGHPAITPMVARVAQAQGTIGNVIIYQSQEFAPFFPPENSAFQSLVITEKLGSRKLSLEYMRKQMLAAGPFEAAFFIGGMEGVEDEFAAVRKLKPAPPCYPLGSTGAAARILLDEYRSTFAPALYDPLRDDLNYFLLFRRLLGLAAKPGGASPLA